MPRKSPSSKVTERVQWALDPKRVGTPDVCITGDAAELEALAQKYKAVVQYPDIEETKGYTCVPGDLSMLRSNADAEDVVSAADAMQRLCTAGGFLEEEVGEVMVQKRRYVGFCDGGLGGRAVAMVREYVQGNEDGVVGGVFVRGIAEGVQCWKSGGWREGGVRGFDGDVGEMFLWGEGGNEWVVQMRAVVDEIG